MIHDIGFANPIAVYRDAIEDKPNPHRRLSRARRSWRRRMVVVLGKWSAHQPTRR